MDCCLFLLHVPLAHSIGLYVFVARDGAGQVSILYGIPNHATFLHILYFHEKRKKRHDIDRRFGVSH
jgi:hypothetical protein